MSAPGIRLPLIETYVRLAAPVLANLYTPDCCIVATRITLDVLGTALGWHVTPWVTEALVANAAMARNVRKSGGFPTSDTQAQAWARQDGAYVLGIGVAGAPPTRGPRQWNAHLVAVVTPTPADPFAYLIDLALGQACRPDKQILVGAYAGPFSHEEYRMVPRVYLDELPGGGVLMYRDRVPVYPPYTESANWRPHPARLVAVTRIVNGLAAASPDAFAADRAEVSV